MIDNELKVGDEIIVEQGDWFMPIKITKVTPKTIMAYEWWWGSKSWGSRPFRKDRPDRWWPNSPKMMKALRALQDVLDTQVTVARDEFETAIAKLAQIGGTE